MPRITRLVPCLWFDSQALPAARHYTRIFPRSRITHIAYYGKAGTEIHGRKPGSVMTVSFELDCQPFTALNGGPHFKFNEAVSLQVMCRDQAEIDFYWRRLTAGGPKKGRVCGWLKDKYGLSWQVMPAKLDSLLKRGTQEQADRAMTAVLQMEKLHLPTIEAAWRGE